MFTPPDPANLVAEHRGFVPPRRIAAVAVTQQLPSSSSAMLENHQGPAILTFKRDLNGVEDHYKQAAKLLLNSLLPPGHKTEGIVSANTNAGMPPGEDTEPAPWRLRHRTLQIQLQQLQPAYRLPAELLNTYLDWAAADQSWTGTRNGCPPPRPPDLLQRATADAYVAGMTLALKTGLDLLVPILSGYFRGLPRHASWGEYRAQDKAIGWMAVVGHGMDHDPLLYRIDQAYRSWIVVALAPGRGHIDDTADMLHWEYTQAERLLTTGRWATPEGCPAHRYAAGLLACLLNEWYRLVNDILTTLTTRAPIPIQVPWQPPGKV
jgi:hypothetical protein